MVAILAGSRGLQGTDLVARGPCPIFIRASLRENVDFKKYTKFEKFPFELKG
jgi:hypothetical protein